MIGIITGTVVFLVPITANQAPANSPDYAADDGTLATANNGPGYGTCAAPNGRAFSLVAPAFFGGLSLSR